MAYLRPRHRAGSAQAQGATETARREANLSGGEEDRVRSATAGSSIEGERQYRVCPPAPQTRRRARQCTRSHPGRARLRPTARNLSEPDMDPSSSDRRHRCQRTSGLNSSRRSSPAVVSPTPRFEHVGRRSLRYGWRHSRSCPRDDTPNEKARERSGLIASIH